jgi:hypothetical protein
MGNPVFNISLGNYRALIEIIHNSDQVTRYKVKLRDKSFVLEQNLIKKSDKWKIKEYTENVDLDKLQKTLPKIIEEIEMYLHPGLSSQARFKNKKSY